MKKLGKIFGLVAIAAIGAVSLVACSGGQKVTEEVWKTALEAKVTQGTITMTKSGKEDGKNAISTSVMKITADKLMTSSSTKIGDEEESSESYYAKEGEKYYEYTKEGEKWSRSEYPKQSFEAMAGFNVSILLAGPIGDAKFSDFKFEKGAYNFTKDDTTVSVVFKSKKVASVKVVEGTGDAKIVTEIKINYGKPSINLPKVG